MYFPQPIYVSLNNSVICRWHINKNVAANCKKYFDQETWKTFLGMWYTVCNSPNVEQYLINLTLWEQAYAEYPAVLDYIRHTWLNDWKTYFVSAWTNLFLHLGALTSSRAESGHAMLKTFLHKRSTGDLLSVFQNLDLAVKQQQNEISVRWNKEKHSRPFQTSDGVFADVACRVSRYALNLVKDLYLQHRQDETSRCSYVTTTTLGIPCHHEVQRRMDLNLKLRMEDFHSHWCISDRDPIVIPLQVPFSLDNQFASISEMFTNSEPHQRIDMMLLLDGLRANPLPAIVDNPLVSVTRGRPAGALNNSRPMVRDNTTTRDPSAFEFVEGTGNPRRKCGICRAYYHNARNCPNKP